MSLICRTLALKSLSNKSITSFLRLTAPTTLTTNSHQFSIRHYVIESTDRVTSTKENSRHVTNNAFTKEHVTNDFPTIPKGKVAFCLAEIDKSELKVSRPTKWRKVRKRIYVENRKRSFIKKNIVDQVNVEALEDFNEWLRKLRFKKWAWVFEGMKWQDIIQLNDTQLMEKGLTTFIVRTELLYYFNVIKTAQANERSNIKTDSSQS
ncbi:9578_t:CDS:2 [Funneliformis caledonium]|uniref:9578_t:CDS:1 n=1 Tax=Funneliformis caledonium TaxID=1117310 RepID=A0A9N8W7I8_9GLOM|nr:9578_t:CDS:2 [Funneliformis caledonium]